MGGPIPFRRHRHCAEAAKRLQEEGLLPHLAVLHQDIFLHVRSLPPSPPPSATPKILGVFPSELFLPRSFQTGFGFATWRRRVFGFSHSCVLLSSRYCDVFFLGALLDWESGEGVFSNPMRMLFGISRLCARMQQDKRRRAWLRKPN